jgi:hypothetical protein
VETNATLFLREMRQVKRTRHFFRTQLVPALARGREAEALPSFSIVLIRMHSVARQIPRSVVSVTGIRDLIRGRIERVLRAGTAGVLVLRTGHVPNKSNQYSAFSSQQAAIRFPTGTRLAEWGFLQLARHSSLPL